MKKSIIICCFLFLHNSFSSTAQTRKLALHKWYWHPANEKTVRYQKGEWNGFTKPQQQKMYDNMAKIIELIHQTPCINPPKGFEVGVWANICENGCIKGKIMSGSSGILFRGFFTTNNDSAIERHAEGPSIRIHFNDITRLLSRLPAGAEAYYEEPAVIGSLRGFPVYAVTNFVAITKRKEPLFTPVTKEELLKIEISDKEKNLEKIKADFKKTNNEWEPLLLNMPAKDSALKKEILKNIADQKPLVEKFEKELAASKAKLANLSASERKEPALNYYGEKKLVLPNKNFFDPSLPAHAIQLVVIDFNESVLNEQPNAYTDLFKQVKETVNMDKILSVLE